MFSIGYATKSINDYITQLKQHGIDVVADIRSVPYSKAFHDYHQEAFKASLNRASIRYVYLGLELGPRSKDPSHYDHDKQVQFHRLIKSDLYQSGVERLFNGIKKGFTIALSCAEKDAATCHRSLLVGWDLLHNRHYELHHIDHDGNLESQSALEKRLMQITETPADMLTTEEEALRLAYEKQCKTFAYRMPKD